MDLRQFLKDRQRLVSEEDEKRNAKSVNRWAAPEHMRIAKAMERDRAGYLVLKWRGAFTKPVDMAGWKQAEKKVEPKL